MTDLNPIPLSQRTILKAEGSEAASFLNRVLTCRTDGVPEGSVQFGALLTPQGKILTDLFVYSAPDALYIDLPQESTADTRKRLTMLKLRADVKFTEMPELAVFTALADDGSVEGAICGGSDPRTSGLIRYVLAADSAATVTEKAAWAKIRTEKCLPEAGLDYAPSELFPADVNMDLLNGVDFKKGCFVGQEVVSRMKRKTEVRKRTVAFRANTEAMPGTSVMCGESTIGEVLFWQNNSGLVLTRIDRLQAGLAKGNSPTISETRAQFELPAGVELPA